MDSARLDQHPLRGARPEGGSDAPPPQPGGPAARAVHVVQLLGGALIVGGIVSVVVAWFGISGTLDPGKQMPYFVSGGLGGAFAVAIGVALFVADEHARDRDALADLLDRLDAIDAMVAGVEAQLERLERLERPVGGSSASAKPARARPTAKLAKVRPDALARARSEGVRVSRGRGRGPASAEGPER